MAKWTVLARDWLAKCEGAGGKLKGEITWWRIGDWQIVGERRGWQIKGGGETRGSTVYYMNNIMAHDSASLNH